MGEQLEISKADGKHAQIGKLVGTWSGIVKTWFEPGELADESAVEGTMRPIFDGQFIIHEYTGSFGGKPLQGLTIIGYDLNTQKFQTAWIDSFHNGTASMFSQGTKGDQQLRVTGSFAYITPEAEQSWGWRTEIDIVSNDELVITAYNISPEGSESKATETVYKRVNQ